MAKKLARETRTPSVVRECAAELAEIVVGTNFRRS